MSELYEVKTEEYKFYYVEARDFDEFILEECECSVTNDGERYKRIQDLSDCPEDAHIGRDLIDGNDIIRYIQMGYNACKNGEELDIVYSDLED